MSPSVGSLFAGIGGFDLAAERAGMTIEWQSENDPKASAVLAHHWPEVPNLGDVNNVRDAPGVDVLTGGFPCQDYSVAGTRGGLAGDRGALWWEYLRLIGDLRPEWVVGENVPGLLSSRDGADFETIVGSLTECGYGVAWAVLDAQYFGVAQRRRRVFIVGHSGGQPRPEILALSEGLFGHPEPSREPGKRTAPTLAARTRGGGWPGSDEAIDGALAFNWQSGGDVRLGIKEEHTDALHSSQTPAVAFSAGNHESSYGIALSEEHTPPLRAGESGTNQVPTVAFAQNQRDEVRDLDDQAGALASEPGMKQQTYVLQEVGARESKNQNGVGIGLTDEEVCYTLQAGQQHGVANAATVRKLTPLECERLQGFPDGWTDIPGNSDTQRYRQLGNAVAVPVVEWILSKLADYLTETNPQPPEDLSPPPSLT